MFSTPQARNPKQHGRKLKGHVGLGATIGTNGWTLFGSAGRERARDAATPTLSRSRFAMRQSFNNLILADF